MNPERPLITNKNELRFFATLGLILVVLLGISILTTKHEEKNKSVEMVQTPDAVDPFLNLKINAKAAYVYDVRTGEVLYEKNADKRLPLASLTKVMTAVVANDIAPLDQIITISPEAIRADGDSGLKVGERWRLKSLIDFSLTSSSNDGAKAIAIGLGDIHTTNPTTEEAEADFINSMNLKASDLGMLNTYFYNETGLDLSIQDGETISKGGAYGTAKDMALLFTYILKNHSNLLEATKRSSIKVTSLDNIVHTAKNTDVIVTKIPGIIGSKTGYTDLAGGNLVIAFDPELGRPIIISVLGSTVTERFTDVRKLLDATLRALSQKVHK